MITAPLVLIPSKSTRRIASLPFASSPSAARAAATSKRPAPSPSSASMRDSRARDVLDGAAPSMATLPSTRQWFVWLK